MAVQAARGMAFLHAQNPAVIHFDLKPDNLLVDGDGETLHVKVSVGGCSVWYVLEGQDAHCRGGREGLGQRSP